VAGGTDASQSAVNTPGSFSATTANWGKGLATTTGAYTPDQIIIVTRHTGTAVIKVFKGEKPPDNPSAFVASEVLQSLGPNVKK
jgi:hypothetical protein